MLQKITYDEIVDPFALKYDGFSNVLDMIIGAGYNRQSKEGKTSDFVERIVNIIGFDTVNDFGIPGLLGYKFKYTDCELKAMSNDELLNALSDGLVDAEGNCFYRGEKIAEIDRKEFAEKLLKNLTWLDDDEFSELKEVLSEADTWWDFCDIPFAKLKIDIRVCGTCVAHYTYGPGWVNPTQVDRWVFLWDILNLLCIQIERIGLCWLNEMHVDQFESEMFLTIDLV